MGLKAMTPEQIAEAVALARTIDEQASPEAINGVALALLAEHERAERLKAERTQRIASVYDSLLPGEAIVSADLWNSIKQDAARWRAVREWANDPNTDADNVSLLLCGGYLWWSGEVARDPDEAADRLMQERETTGI